MNRLAIATVGATFVLILAGGLVTNTGAGLAVPDRATIVRAQHVPVPLVGHGAGDPRPGTAVRRQHGADRCVESAVAR